MKERPLPDLETVYGGYQVDLALNQIHERFLQSTLEDMRNFLVKHEFYDFQLVPEPFSGLYGCYLLRRRVDPNASPLIKDTRKVQAKLAEEMGICPAPTYNFVPEYYNPIFVQEYRYSFSYRCRHGRSHCIHPAHLSLYTYDGRPIIFATPIEPMQVMDPDFMRLLDPNTKIEDEISKLPLGWVGRRRRPYG